MKRFLTACIMCVWGQVSAAQTCDGQYTDADTLIEAAYGTYGTLYSGGTDYASVGPTLEIYRLLNGLPDSGMATRRPGSAEFIDPAGDFSPQFVGETLVRSLTRLHDPDFRRDLPEGSTDSEVLLNRLTVLGPYAGWWLTPDAPHLTPVEKVIAQYAVDDGLDWLLSVQAASARPHQISWHLQRYRLPRDMAGVMGHAAQRYESSQSLAWMVAIETLAEGNGYYIPETVQPVRDRIGTRLALLRAAVNDCSATPAQYVAFSITAFEKLRQNSGRRFDLELAMQLPPALRRIAATQMAKHGMREYYRPSDDLTPAALATLSGDPAFAAWHNIGRSYRAETLDELIAIHQGTPLDLKTYRLLNLLSADDLLTFARSREDGTNARRDLISTAYLRLFALGRDADAEALIDELQSHWPDRADLMNNLWSSSAPRDVRLARVALAIPEPRTVVTPRSNRQHEIIPPADQRFGYWTGAYLSRDLPFAIRSGGFLDRNVRDWMEAVSIPNASGWATNRRTYRRGILAPDVMRGMPDPIPSSRYLYYRNIGIAGFAAWDELARLGPETGLANRIGRVLVTHAEASTSNFWNSFRADKDQLAAEMELIIWQGRRMIHGERDGRPLGQAAFAVLQGPLFETEIAKANPYWFICRERCAP